jgi:glutathione S-transferase
MDLEPAGAERTTRSYNGLLDAIEFASLKPLLPFGRLPVARIEGQTIAQSGAILRSLAGMKHDASTCRLADMWYEQTKEAFGTHQAWGNAFNVSALREATAEQLSAAPSHYRGTSNRGEYTPFEKSLVAIRTFEEQLLKTGRFLTGAELTYADLALFLRLWELIEDDGFPLALSTLGLPTLKAFVETVARMPTVASFLTEKRMPRNGPHDGKSYPFKPGRQSLQSLQAHDEL